MSKVITVAHCNSVYINVFTSERSIEKELWDFFTFKVPNAQFMPKYKSGHWDGKLHLYNLRNKTLYYGLYYYLINFAKERGYEIQVADGYELDSENPLSEIELKEYIEGLDLPFEIRDYQFKTILTCLRRNRRTIVSPTASGKSLNIYVLSRYLIDHDAAGDILVVVPTKGLVHQLVSDFKDYSKNNKWNVEAHTSKIMGGYEKDNTNKIVVSTWQSIYTEDREWFEKFGTVIVDEVHEAKAKSTTTLLEKCMNCDRRFGFTGTLDGIPVHKFTIEGLLGPAVKIVDTDTLIKRGTLSEMAPIKCLILDYSDQTKTEFKRERKTYHEELAFLVSNKKRQKFISNLASSLKGNTLILFQLVEKQGLELFEMIKENNKGKKDTFYVDGKVHVDDREDIRKYVEAKGENCDIVASFGTFQRGINIVNLDNIIFASPSKSRIRILQSIGRGLRKKKTGGKLTIFDISDKLSNNLDQSKINFTMIHMLERIKLYNTEKFKYTINTIKLEK